MFVRRSAQAGLLPVLALALALAGCGGDDEIEPKMPESSSAASTSTAESPSPTKPVEPTLPPEAEGDDAGAAEAFVRHYFAVLNHAQATGDTRTLKSLGLVGCHTCDGSRKAIDRIYEAGGVVNGGRHRLHHLRSTPLRSSAQAFRVGASVSNTRQEIKKSGTELDGVYPAGRVSMTLVVIRDQEKWHVADWQIES